MSFLVTMAVLWEFYEYLSSLVLRSESNTHKDILADVALGMSGSVSVLAVYSWLTSRPGRVAPVCRKSG